MDRSALIVDPVAGTVCWMTKTGNQKTLGARNGRYYRAQVAKQSVYLHRIVYEHVHGPIPKGMQIDHINGNGLDNRIINLRLVTPKQNQENQMRAQSNSKTQMRGVSLKKSSGKYMAKIKHNGRHVYLGYFDTAEKASFAYASAAASYHTHNPAALR